MATYLISAHTLLLRVLAQPSSDEEQPDCVTTFSNDLRLDVRRTTRLKMIDRNRLDVRSISCPATTIERSGLPQLNH
jgi:hypothetical protein